MYDVELLYGNIKFPQPVRGPKLRVDVSNFGQQNLGFSSLANFQLKNGAQFNRNIFKQPSLPNVH